MKFSIVTPVYNDREFLAETIESVLLQRGDFVIEYILVDNCSTDGSLDIVKEYATLVTEDRFPRHCGRVSLTWVSEKDRGMYDAINKGFARASGDVFAWLNADDIYLPGAFDLMSRVFAAFPAVEWAKGITSYIDEKSHLVRAGRCLNYDAALIREGVYGRDAYFIQQDSVFWRSRLWRRAGGIDPALRYAGDYSLWRQFARHTSLYSVACHVSCFRRRKGQLSEDFSAYREECKALSLEGRDGTGRKARFFFQKLEPRLPVRLRPLAYRIFFGGKEFEYLAVEEGKPVLRRTNYYRVD